MMRDLSATRDIIQAVADGINSATYAPDLAARTKYLLDRLPSPGIYHLKERRSNCARARHAFPAQGTASAESHPAEHQAGGIALLAGGAGGVSGGLTPGRFAEATSAARIPHSRQALPDVPVMGAPGHSSHPPAM